MYTPPHLPDTQALTDFREHTADVLKELARSDRPLLLTQRGKAAGVVMSTHAYEQLAEAAELARSIESVRQGMADIRAGRVIPVAEAMTRLRKKHGMNGKPRGGKRA